jgi:hypothetical protein
MSDDGRNGLNSFVHGGVTDERGICRFTVPAGTYRLDVITPPGYLPAPPKTVTVEEGETISVVFELDQEGDWFRSLPDFIPKTVLEPFYGDLCEVRARLSAKGRSRSYIGRATSAQVVILLIRWLLQWGKEILRVWLQRLLIGP